MEIRHLRYFVMVAEELHFSRAAARLNISVATLSQQIRSLESILGARLFNRRTKSAVEMTHAGKRFLSAAQASLKQMAQTELVGRRAARGDTGVIALGYVFSACCSGLIPAALKRFKLAQPDVSIQARLIETMPQFKAIIDGSLDVGVMRMPHRYPSNLTGMVIDRQSFRVALPVDHRLAGLERIEPAALDGEPLIAAPLEMEPGFHGNISAVMPARLDTNIVECALDAFSMLTLVAAGFGVGIISGALSRIALPGIVYRDLVGVRDAAVHVAVYRKNESAPVVMKFIKALRENFTLRDAA